MEAEKVIHFGSDHAGVELKRVLKEFMIGKAFNVEDHGTHTTESCDYPDYAHKTATAVAEGNGMGVLICGSANGVCMTANKHRGIRAALAWNNEVAKLARQHNNANIICIPARFVSNAEAEKILEAFLATDFEGGRHERRVEKIELSK